MVLHTSGLVPLLASWRIYAVIRTACPSLLGSRTGAAVTESGHLLSLAESIIPGIAENSESAPITGIYMPNLKPLWISGRPAYTCRWCGVEIRYCDVTFGNMMPSACPLRADR
eukprot:1762293-Amphidinium_carterae.2